MVPELRRFLGLSMIPQGCSIFYVSRTRSESSDEESCPDKRNVDKRNAISIIIPLTTSFIPERAFFVTKLLFRNLKFLSSRKRCNYSFAMPNFFPLARDSVNLPQCQILFQSRIYRKCELSGILPV